MNNLIDAFIAAENGLLKGLRTAGTGLQRVTCADLTTQNGLTVDRAVIPQVVGTAASPQCPNNVTVAIAWRTGLRGRSFRGRTYHIGMSTTYTITNQLVSTVPAPMLAAYTTLISLGVAPVFHLGVLSRQINKVVQNPRVFTPVTACTLDINLDSQRRRLAGK